MSCGSGRRPGPNSPHAISPSAGSITRTPSAFSCATLRWVAACSHMRTFIAGATTTGLSVASSSVVARSSAMPAAILASRSAVAGQTSTKSAARLSWIWPISTSSLSSHSERVDLAFGQRAEAHRGDEMLAALGQHRRHRMPGFLEQPHELQRLVRRDPAADDEEHACHRSTLAQTAAARRSARRRRRRAGIAPPGALLDHGDVGQRRRRRGGAAAADNIRRGGRSARASS